MSLKAYVEKNRKRLKKRRKLIAFLSIIAVLGLSTATYAWFTVNTFAGVQDFELQISTGYDLRVSMDNHGSDIDKYTHVITNEMLNSYLRKNYNKTLEDIILDPVTTNDGKNFTYQGGQKAEPNGEESYFEFECYFIATKDMKVYLTTEGTDEEGKKIEGTKVSTESPAPQSDIVKAIRLAFDGEGDALKTYEPNKGAKVTALTTFDLPSGAMDYNSSNNLFSLEKLKPKKVAVRLWMEGEDPECDNDVQRANLKIQLSFVGLRDIVNGNPVA
ncbi:MAG: hypothetical protein J1E41_05140 [Ruminococcus sp.]|nr:hypothetical protein [Ruminococcus sp.]